MLSCPGYLSSNCLNCLNSIVLLRMESLFVKHLIQDYSTPAVIQSLKHYPGFLHLHLLIEVFGYLHFHQWLLQHYFLVYDQMTLFQILSEVLLGSVTYPSCLEECQMCSFLDFLYHVKQRATQLLKIYDSLVNFHCYRTN